MGIVKHHALQYRAGMLPWGHLAVGYLCYSLGVRLRYRHPPRAGAVLALVFGTQLPDLIDKPLATWLGVLPSGRSLGHSLLFLAVLGVGVWWLAKRRGRVLAGVALLVGHLTHIVVDALPALVAGRWVELGHLLWPVTPVYQYPGELERDMGAYLLAALMTLQLDTVLFVVAVLVWIYDGAPGLRHTHDWLGTRRSEG